MTKNTSHQNSNALTQDAYAGVKVQIQPATVLRRALAYCIDLGFAGVLCYIMMFVAFILISGMIGFAAVEKGKDFSLPKYVTEKIMHPAAGDWLVLIVLLGMLLLLLLVNHGYFIWHEFKKGTTPGKRFMGLKVISLDGGKLTLKQCIGREALRYIDCTLFIPGILTIMLTEKKQRLGDLFAGTIVVYSRALENEIHYLYLSRENFLLIESQVSVGYYSEEDEVKCMHFAYQYLGRKIQFDQATLEKWENFADALVTANDDFSLDPQDKFLFVAELFRQKSIARKPA
ncbi:MAG: RDD family protein [Oligoflexus sp.]|nr:RDD family protein [Oligoflexus sp.]